MTTRSSEHRESAAMFKHQLQKSEEDRHKQAALIQKLQKSEEDLTVKAADQESLIKRLEMKLDMNRERLEKVGKDNKALLHKSEVTQIAEKNAWESASGARMRIVDDIDEALLTNPNHFNVFSLDAFKNRSVVVASTKFAPSGTAK
mmetsp:Transcript_56363/g.133156  ORF Transcript_56363/g.133156 Transcript_56363/m.133156 type:complete len:146 (+) Transcript_56363:96-533(+)